MSNHLSTGFRLSWTAVICYMVEYRREYATIIKFICVGVIIDNTNLPFARFIIPNDCANIYKFPASWVGDES